MFKTILSSRSYWKSVTLLAIGFIVLFSLIELIMQYQGFNFSAFVTERINEGKWLRYALSRVIGGLMYGMILGYHFESRKLKKKRK
ncbi:hypothetical protein [Aquimarina intermedia]|uniref:Uncharacterized protein n=1 Tax=Aquimarina intermedia TaxID=350814 RepID=A0A5S5C8Z7_9FLAO|nr:hypothetical protein [Aquimarina intermedia]TYP75875.1 hypothetical protein BD809_10283 [Aquimarina intermedia]